MSFELVGFASRYNQVKERAVGLVYRRPTGMNTAPFYITWRSYWYAIHTRSILEPIFALFFELCKVNFRHTSLIDLG